MKKSIAILASVALSCSLAVAQPAGGNPPQGAPQPGVAPQGRPQRMDPDKVDINAVAVQRADEMNKVVGLNEKQYDKVISYFQKDLKYRKTVAKNALKNAGDEEEDGAPEGGPDGGPMGGGPGGGPMGGGPGGGPGMGGGPMGGGPGMMGGPMGGSSTRPKLVDDDYIKSQNKKLRKIIGQEKFDQWRSVHPIEMDAFPGMGGGPRR